MSPNHVALTLLPLNGLWKALPSHVSLTLVVAGAEVAERSSDDKKMATSTRITAIADKRERMGFVVLMVLICVSWLMGRRFARDCFSRFEIDDTVVGHCDAPREDV